MKNLLYAGHELTTTDAVAEALLDFVVTLARTQPPESVNIPVLMNGRSTDVQLILTAVTPVAAASIDMSEVALNGADLAVEILRRKTERLDSVGIG